jgi:hypothetical protein
MRNSPSGNSSNYQEQNTRFKDQLYESIAVEADTIPRINNKLYKLQKALRRKEVECISSNSDITFITYLSKICKEIMVNNIDLERLEKSGNNLSQKIAQIESVLSNENPILILALRIQQAYSIKHTLVKQEEEFSYAFGGFSESSGMDFLAQSPIHRQEDLSNGKFCLIVTEIIDNLFEESDKQSIEEGNIL